MNETGTIILRQRYLTHNDTRNNSRRGPKSPPIDGEKSNKEKAISPSFVRQPADYGGQEKGKRNGRRSGRKATYIFLALLSLLPDGRLGGETSKGGLTAKPSFSVK
ncbi:MAG: hypothetical protein NT098_02910 [Candidatus Parcubacteria bacterium]|nr:hypothetical protein [Candidatus Parcubacteria bacterium]